MNLREILDHLSGAGISIGGSFDTDADYIDSQVDKAQAQIIELIEGLIPEKKTVFVDPDENIQSASNAGYNSAVADIRSCLETLGDSKEPK